MSSEKTGQFQKKRGNLITKFFIQKRATLKMYSGGVVVKRGNYSKD